MASLAVAVNNILSLLVNHDLDFGAATRQQIDVCLGKHRDARTDGSAAPKFTLKDEARKSTLHSSKRLWQGSGGGQKLRHFPVEFTRAVETYDPGEYLRQQMAENAARQDLQTQEHHHDDLDDAGRVAITPEIKPMLGKSDGQVMDTDTSLVSENNQDTPELQSPGYAPASTASHTSPAEINQDDDDDDDEPLALPVEVDMVAGDLADIKVVNGLQETATASRNERDSDPPRPIRPSTPSSFDAVNQDVSLAVEGLRLGSPVHTATTTRTSNVDFILDRLPPTTEKESDSAVTPSALEASELSMDSINEHDYEHDHDESSAQEGHGDDAGDLPYIIDTVGDAFHEPAEEAREHIILQPRRAKTQTFPTTGVEPLTTAWARTVNDPVVVSPAISPQSTQKLTANDAFEHQASSKRGRRGGRKKQAVIQAAVRGKRQDEIDIMFDYMENAMWTDEEDKDQDEDEDEEAETETETFLMQMLSHPDGQEPTDAATRILGELRGVDSSSQNEQEEADEEEESDEDDTDIDDDLELMIEAEMEEMEFDLGYTGGRSGKGNRYGAARELVDQALYHEDFNVYEYNSEDDEEQNGVEALTLPASGARQRGLKQFISNLDLSDEELEATLIAQWKKDRGSKRERKKAREKLHEAGVLGKKAKRARASHALHNNNNDAGHHSADLDAYHTHIQRFCTHADYIGIAELPMPAMDKAVRRAVHVLSQAYGLKSASQGSGKRRHIVLYKTKHALHAPDAAYLEETLFRARRSLGFNSKYRDTLLPDSARKRLGRSGRPMRHGPTTGGGGRGGAGRLRDGDLVGADAPEIHVANRGRQMLEKLGWLHGTGLGAEGKEGINLPLFATIKNTKHGLQ